MGNAVLACGLLSVLVVGLSGCESQSAVSTEPSMTRGSTALATKPRNVILFLGDGMGVSTVTAARIFAGQAQGLAGEEHVLSFEEFPNVALVKTYNTDLQVPDSAGTMTALVTGYKTRAGVLSVDAAVARGDCAGSLEQGLPTLLEQAEDAGLRTGLVSTARITHATPAANYAHSPDRDWEDNARLPEAAVAAGCRDIARQLVEFSHGDGIDVVFGGGRANFYPTTWIDPEYPDVKGRRTDARDLVGQWLLGSEDREYVWNLAGFAALKPQTTQVLGLFEPSHMQYEADRSQDPAGEPSLADLTAAAIERLTTGGSAVPGFYLMVEAGRIDHGHHRGNAYRALTDTVALDDAVRRALSLVDLSDTLIIVTADHSHTLTISGYPRRGNPILGKVQLPDQSYQTGSSGLPYTTLGYANGPGANSAAADITQVDTEARDYRQAAAIPMGSETHAGEDVAAYAHGPGAELVRGVVEQNELYRVLSRVLP